VNVCSVTPFMCPIVSDGRNCIMGNGERVLQCIARSLFFPLHGLIKPCRAPLILEGDRKLEEIGRKLGTEDVLQNYY
jgi:hypothetical protein